MRNFTASGDIGRDCNTATYSKRKTSTISLRADSHYLAVSIAGRKANKATYKNDGNNYRGSIALGMVT